MLVFVILAFVLGRRDKRKLKSLRQSSWIWIKFGTSLRLISLMNLTLILFRPINIQWCEPFSCDFVQKKKNKLTNKL